MRFLTRIYSLCITAAIALSASSPGQTIARLNHEVAPDVPHTVTVNPGNYSEKLYRHPAPLPESALSRLAARTWFVNSDLERASHLAQTALERDRHDAEALFVRMEVAGMQADDARMLDSAIRLCEVGAGSPNDPRVRLAAARIRELAANAPDFRKTIPRVQALLANSSNTWPDLHAALLNAAMDGAPGLDPYAISRASGILTDWRIVGPLGRHPLLDFDQDFVSPGDDLQKTSYQSHAVENFQFPDGRIVLPDYLSRRGVFYAATRFASLTPGNWTVTIESATTAELYVDGMRVLHSAAGLANTRSRTSASFDITAGPHRVVAKFVGSSAPLRVTLSKSAPQNPVPRPTKAFWQELAYCLAAERYASEDFDTAVQQINAVHSAATSAPLQFLLAQSLAAGSTTTSDYATAWDNLRLLVPSALAADLSLSRMKLKNGNAEEAARLARRVLEARPSNPRALETLTTAWQAAPVTGEESELSDLWSRRVTMHPSCETLLAALTFYRPRNAAAQAESISRKLEGCAPESPDYARVLSEQGSHAEAALSLQRLLAAAPLNRAARLMLVRESQLAGNDAEAQRAAAEWVRIAPNAEIYHRLAAYEPGQKAAVPGTNTAKACDFYLPYRRDVLAILRQNAKRQLASSSTVLLDDHVAIARPDGSVSLYVHTARRLSAQSMSGPATLPPGAQAIQQRLVHPDGSITAIGPNSGTTPLFSSGVVLDEEYVVHYAGDGGIAEHPEAFQFVFGNLNEPVLSARFVALTPAEHADRGIVIATGEAPRMTEGVQNGMLSRTWQYSLSPLPATPEAPKGLAIVRVVEEDNGWAVPRNAERQRRIETIHRGPRLEDSAHHTHPCNNLGARAGRS